MMENKFFKNKQLTVGVALVILFVGIALFVPNALNAETDDPSPEETRQEETVPMRLYLE